MIVKYAITPERTYEGQYLVAGPLGSCITCSNNMTANEVLVKHFKDIRTDLPVGQNVTLLRVHHKACGLTRDGAVGIERCYLAEVY